MVGTNVKVPLATYKILKEAAGNEIEEKERNDTANNLQYQGRKKRHLQKCFKPQIIYLGLGNLPFPY